MCECVCVSLFVCVCVCECMFVSVCSLHSTFRSPAEQNGQNKETSELSISLWVGGRKNEPRIPRDFYICSM